MNNSSTSSLSTMCESFVDEDDNARRSRKESSLDDTLERLSCFIKQWQKHYTCHDYLSSCYQNDNIDDYDSFSSIDSISALHVVEEIAKFVTCPSLLQDSLSSSSKDNVRKKVDRVIPPPPSPSSVVVHKKAHYLPTSERNNYDKYKISSASSPPTPPNNNASTTATAKISKCCVSLKTDVLSWREKMLDWSYGVVDSLQMDHELVSIALNIFDRFISKEIISTPTNYYDNDVIHLNREEFQLFFVTSLYVAAKTFVTDDDCYKLSLECIVDMCGGYYTVDDIVETEYEILTDLNWLINPPTGLTFCDLYWSIIQQQLLLLSSSSSSQPKRSRSSRSRFCHPTVVTLAMRSTCQTMVELATYDSFFISKPSWLIGLAAVLLSCDIDRRLPIPSYIKNQFILKLKGIIDVDQNTELNECYYRLNYLYNATTV